MLAIIRDSLKESTVVGRSTDQDSDQVTAQDKTPVDPLFQPLGGCGEGDNGIGFLAGVKD